MKVLIILALVAAASCAPSERPKRNLYPIQYSAGLSPVLQASEVQSNTLESTNIQSTAIKSTSSKSSYVQPTLQQVYQPAVASYQPAVYQAAYQPSYYSYQQQPSYYSAPVHSVVQSVVPVQSAVPVHYNVPAQVQYVHQPEVVYSNQYHSVPSVQGLQYNSGVVDDPWC